MSVIVAIKNKNKVYFGSDTQVTIGAFKSYASMPSDYKVQKKGDFLVACVGNVRSCRVLMENDHLFKTTKIDQVNKEFIVERVVNKLLLLLEEQQFLEKDSDGVKSLNISLLIAYQNNLFQVTDYGGVYILPDYGVIGSGTDYIIPYLMNFKKDENVKKTLIKALRFANQFEQTISNPFVLIDSDKLFFEVVED